MHLRISDLQWSSGSGGSCAEQSHHIMKAATFLMRYMKHGLLECMSRSHHCIEAVRWGPLLKPS